MKVAAEPQYLAKFSVFGARISAAKFQRAPTDFAARFSAPTKDFAAKFPGRSAAIVNESLSGAARQSALGLSGAPLAELRMVKFENVGLRYGLGTEVLRDVSFQIAPNSFQFLTGPSGAGKTSLLRLLFLTLKPTRGLINLFGNDVATLSKDAMASLRRRIGIVFQDFRLLDHLNTFENVALPFRVIDRSEDSYRHEVIELLRWVGLGDRMWSFPAVLSGGEKQRAAIARAVITRPQLLLADEPTGNVDPALARRLLRLFVELNKFGTSVIIATHDIALMEQSGARRLVLHNGGLHDYA